MFGLWTLELLSFDLNIGSLVKKLACARWTCLESQTLIIKLRTVFLKYDLRRRIKHITGNYVFGILGASSGRILMKIGGDQADAFPDLPIQPKTLDFTKKIKQIRKTHSKTIAEIFLIRSTFEFP